MSVAQAYISSPIDKRELKLFLWFGIATLIFGICGALLNMPYAGLIPGLFLLCALLVRSPIAMLISLFATFSVAVHLGFLTLDTPVLLLLICYWYFNKKKHNIQDEFVWVRRLAWANVVWIGILFTIHINDYDNWQWVVGTGIRLILYFVMFIVTLDIVKELSRKEILHVIRWAWFFSIIVSIIAIYQHYGLGLSRVNSILEAHHAHLGDYATVGALLGGIITVWTERSDERLIGWVSIILALLAVVLSESRASIIGVSVGLAFFGLLGGFRGIVVVSIVVALLYGSGLITQELQKEKGLTFQQSREYITNANLEKANYDVSSVTRVFEWVGVLNFEQKTDILHILCGVGPGNFGEAMRPYTTLYALYVKQPGTSLNGAHNNYLHVLAELGFVGSILFWGFLVFLSYMVLRLGKRGNHRQKNITKITIATTVALFVSGITQETFYSQLGMGNFLGLYLVVIVLILHLKTDKALISQYKDK